MAGKILPPGGNAAARFKIAGGALVAFIFWLIVAALFPYPVLAPYWPAAITWAPAVLYLLAFFNLLKALYHAAQAMRLARPGRSLGRGMGSRPAGSASRVGEGIRARQADRQARSDREAEHRAANADGRNRTLPPITRAPTVQRMR